MARSKKRRSRKKALQKPFPFMSLPLEIRFMVYDTLINEQTASSYKRHVQANLILMSDSYIGLSSRIKSLMRVKDIRDELVPHLLSRYQFEWADTGAWQTSNRWVSFKRYVFPFINSLTISIHDPGQPRADSTKLFRTILKWIRWRSQHSYHHPWQLKSLTLTDAARITPKKGIPTAYPNTNFTSWMKVARDRVISCFLMEAPMVPGLDFFTIVLKFEPQEQAAKVFLGRCASCGAKGRVGYWRRDRKKVEYWLQLQDGQLVRTDL